MNPENETTPPADEGRLEASVRPRWEHEFEQRLWNRAADAPRLTRRQCSAIGKEADERIAHLEEMLFARGAMADAPCFCCGYSGAGYFQPEIHPCAARHHDGYGSDGA